MIRPLVVCLLVFAGAEAARAGGIVYRTYCPDGQRITEYLPAPPPPMPPGALPGLLLPAPLPLSEKHMPSVEEQDPPAEKQGDETAAQDQTLTVTEWGQGQWFRAQDGTRWFYIYGPLSANRPARLTGRQVHTKDGQDLFFTRDGRLFRALPKQPLPPVQIQPMQQRLPNLPGLADPHALLQR